MSARRAAGLAALALAAAAWVVFALLLWRSSRVPASLRLPKVDLGALFTAHQLARARSFERFIRIDWLLSELALLGVLAVYARRGARFARESAAGRTGTGLLLGMLGLGIVWLAQLPFGFAEVWWERRWGIGHESYAKWLLGGWLSLAGAFLFVCTALVIVMGLARVLGGRWWLVGGPVFVVLAALFTFVQPYLLGGTHPLRDRALLADAERFARAEGLPRIKIVVQDVHAETSSPNAEAVGLGPTRRVVLWDTLLDGRFTPREVRLVVAHELGHLSRNHLLKGLAWFALFAIPGAWVIARATRRRGGMAEPAAVPLALFVLVVLQLLALPLQVAISRHFEAEADWMALRTTRDPAAATGVFRKFTTVALEQPDPPDWAYLLLADHPTIEQRIGMAKAWRNLHPAPG
ncbi:MAG TPA: M48 family metalloprotease [Gaiellaceae bacterium]|nr:M48 family metalloprotease [Gaiellaceae bacterium]